MTKAETSNHLGPLKLSMTFSERLNTKRFFGKSQRGELQKPKRFYSRFLDCFKKFDHQDGNGRPTASVADQMLTYISDPLPTSLLKMKLRERKLCTEMYKHVLDWMSLTNAVRDVAQRNVALQKIMEIANSNNRLRDELCLQVLKQTRDSPNRNTERNAWKLFSVIVNKVTCSRRMLNFVAAYLRSVEVRLSKDPLITKITTEMADHVRNSLLKRGPFSTLRRLPNPQNNLGEYYCFPVYVSDDSRVDAIYDADTVIEDLIPQLAWTIGLPDDDTFALYECRGSRYMQIDRKRLMTAVVSDISDRGSGEDAKVRLFMKKTKSSRASMEGLDRDSIYRMYLETKDKYRQGGYPLAAIGEVAMRLCVYLIQAEDAAELFENERELSRELNNFLPSTSLRIKEREEWVDGVLTKYAHIGRIEAEAARLHFLDCIEAFPTVMPKWD